MKKMALVLAASTLAAAMLTGCGSKGVEVDVENMPTYAELTAKEYGDKAYVKNLDIAKLVTLGDYKGLELSVEKVAVDEAEVEDYISGQVEDNPFEVEITDRGVEEGDTVNIDYIGLMRDSGVQFDGGTAQDQELVIGSSTYIDGFEDGLIGLKTGEVTHLELTFPEDYANEELAGADVVFTVTVNKIYTEEPAELSDEWVQILEIEGVSTVDEYRDYVYDLYLKYDQSRYDSELQNAALAAIIENAEFKGDYTDLWQRYVDTSLANVLYQTSYYGFDLETFAMLYGGLSVEEFVDELIGSSEAGVKQTLATQAIAQAEGLEVTQEDIDAKIEENAAYYGYTVEAYTAAIGDVSENDDFLELIMTDKVLNFVVDNAVITEIEPVAETESETESAE